VVKFVVFLTAAVLAAAPLPLTPQRTAIVTVPVRAAAEEQAAQLLQEWLRKATKSKTGFDIRTGTDHKGVIISLGAVSGAPSPPDSRDGFRIQRRGDRISIVGGSPEATFYGAARFLDLFAGVRFYMPRDLFTSLPATGRVEMGETDITEIPYVRNSMMSGTGGMRGTGGQDKVSIRTEERDWLRRNGIIRKDYLEFSHQHSMYQRFPAHKFGERMPEIYPILQGKRYIPTDPRDQKWQPCLTEPKLVDAAVDSASDYFRAHPDRRYLSFSVQDSHAHCECDRCLREVAAAGGNKAKAYSAMNARFLNAAAERLEKTHPDRTLVYIAYAEVREPPPVPMHKSVLPVLVFTIGDSLIDKRFEPGSHILDQWKAFSQLGNHDWGQGNMYFIPRVYTGLTSRLFREAKQRNLTWGYQHMESYPNWGLDGFKLWVTSRIWWNPEVDVPSLWRQIARDMFPGSAWDMERYFELLHELWIRMDNDAERKLRKWSNQFDLRSDEQRNMVRECRRILDSAVAAAKSPEERERAGLLSKSFRLSEHFFELANAQQVSAQQVEALRAYARDAIAPDPWTHYLGGSPAALMKDVDDAVAVITKGKLAESR